jgi:hypothetical protein
VQDSSERRGLIGIVSVFAVAGLTRLWILAQGVPLFHDQVLYVRMAELLDAGRWRYPVGLDTPCLYELPTAGLSACYPPLFPVLMSGLSMGPVAPAMAGLAISFVAGLCTLLLLNSLLKAVLRPTWRLVALSGVALSPLSHFIGTTAFTESLYICLVTAAMAALVVPKSRPLGTGAAAGGALGLAYLARPEAVTLVPIFLVLIAFRWLDWSWMRRALQGAALLVGFAVVVGPPIAHLQANGHVRAWHQEKAAFGAVLDERLVRMPLEEAYFALNEDGSRFQVSAPTETAAASAQMASAPVAFAVRRVVNAWDKAGQLLPAGGPITLVMSLIALGVPLATRRRRALLVSTFLIALLGYTLALNIVSQARLLAMSVPPLFALVGWCMQLIASTSTAQRPWARRPGQVLVGLVVLALLVVSTVGATVLVKVRAGTFFTSGPVADWLRDNTDPSAALATHEPAIPYYAGRRHLTLPAAATSQQLCAYLETAGADLLVLTPREVEAHRLPPLGTVPCLSPVVVPAALAEGVEVYGVVGAPHAG